MTTATTPAPDSDAAPRFTLRQRLQLALISWAGYLAVALIGPTLRYTVTGETDEAAREPVHPGIFAFWHRCVIPATYCFRRHGIAVMTSQSFDGEYIARVIRRFGYIPVRGSSTRGGARGLLEMQSLIDRGHSAAFTIDGPRGPLYVAKPGAVALARATGVRVVPFYVALDRPWILRSWDRMMIPRPFSRALVRLGEKILVPLDADPATFDRCQAALQAGLERVRDWAEAHVAARN